MSNGFRQPRDWYTSVQDNTLRKMKRLGFSAPEIADKLGRTEKSVRERASILGIPWTKEAGSSTLSNAPSHERSDEAARRQMDEGFQRLLKRAWQQGEFPGQKFRLVGE